MDGTKKSIKMILNLGMIRMDTLDRRSVVLSQKGIQKRKWIVSLMKLEGLAHIALILGIR